MPEVLLSVFSFAIFHLCWQKRRKASQSHPFAPFVYAYYPIYFGFVSCNFFMFEGFIWFFFSCSHKGFLTKFIKHLKDMNFLREDLVFSTHSEEVLLTFFLFSSVLLYLACFLLNQVFFYARGHTHFVYC